MLRDTFNLAGLSLPYETINGISEKHASLGANTQKPNALSHIKPPASLSYETTLTLHTKSAFLLFQGKKGNVGLFRFAKLVNKIVSAASLDDPYADLFLCKVFDSLKRVHTHFQNEGKKFKPLLESRMGLNYRLARSKNPAIINLSFATNYGFMAAELISFYDYLFVLIKSITQLGMPLKEPLHEISKRWIEQLKDAFNLPKQYQSLGITRLDIQQQTPLAEKALTLMGKIDQKIVNKIVRAPYAPKILKKNFEVT